MNSQHEMDLDQGFELARILRHHWPWEVRHEYDDKKMVDDVCLLRPSSDDVNENRLLKVACIAHDIPEVLVRFDNETINCYGYYKKLHIFRWCGCHQEAIDIALTTSARLKRKLGI